MLITGVLAVACAPAAPVSPAATAAPAKPAAAPAASPGASPAASPAASPGAAVAPATAPAAVAQVKPKGSMTMVIESEPATILLKDATTENAYFVLDNVFDKLTAREWSIGRAEDRRRAGRELQPAPDRPEDLALHPAEGPHLHQR